MPRALLTDAQIHPAIRDKIASAQATIVREVQATVAAHPVVVVGMEMNPYPKKARRLLDHAQVAHHDLDYGSYFSMWRQRNAIKMWSGWPTFPMVFVRGTLIGGADDLAKLISSGELKRMLGAI